MYFSGGLEPGHTCSLPPPQAHHAVRVLRLETGDAVTLFNGDGADYDAVVERAGRESVTVKVLGRRCVERESSLEIVLGQAVSIGERMEFTVRKAVELGVAAIQPLAAERSVVRLGAERAARRIAHWRAVAIAACEQCGRNRVPAVEPLLELHEWLARIAGAHDHGVRLMLTPRGAGGLRERPKPAGSVMLLAGPEGGLAPEEERAAERAGFQPVRLGPRVLRTETAALAALAAMQALWGDF